MRWLSVLAASAAVLIVVSSAGPRALALPAGAQVVLAFGERYRGADGAERTHHGVDVSCRPGDPVIAPLSGTVVFVGRVPAAGGATQLCVTIASGDLRMSLMPLSAASVGEGVEVATGDRIGEAAGLGDPSSDEPHLHVGLKRAGLYVDPSPLLRVEGSAPTAGEPAPGPVELEQPQSADAEPALDAVVGGELARKPAQVPVPGSSGLAIAPHAASLAPASGHAQRAEPQGSHVVDPAEASRDPVAGSVEGAKPAAAGPFTVVRQPAVRAGAPHRAQAAARAGCRRVDVILSAPALASVIAALFGVMLLISRSALASYIRSSPLASSRLGRLLQQLRAGDTLCGLTSCPGLAPSPSRGRSVQRR